MVPKQSAILGLVDEDPIPVNSSHREMCRFTSEHDADFENLTAKVRAASESRSTTALIALAT